MNDIIQAQLSKYQTANAIEEENATKEIVQEIALYGLWRAKFFDVAVRRIRNAVIKDNSVANQLDLSFGRSDARKKLKIKLEIDVQPPAHSNDDFTFLDFPVDYEVRHQDLCSNFALKIHALLCRDYVKGRDWYDFSWYVAQGVFPNLQHLEAALKQFGPWSGDECLSVDQDWLEQTLAKRIKEIDWEFAKQDVRRFLRSVDAESLRLWSNVFFETKLMRLLKIA